MFYIVAFVIGGCARSASRAALFAVVYVALCGALLFAVSADGLRTGATSVPYVLRHVAMYAAIGVVVTAAGYVCRVLVGERLARSAEGGGDAAVD